MDRRRFIVGSAVTAGFAAAGASAVALRKSAALPAPARPLGALDPRSFGVLVCLARRLVPDHTVDALDVVHDVDGALRYASVETQADIRLALALFENGLVGAATRGSWGLFSELGPAEQDRAIDAWSRSVVDELRKAITSLRKLCYGALYARLSVAQAVGYPGPFFEKGSPGPIEARRPLSPPYRREIGHHVPSGPGGSTGPSGPTRLGGQPAEEDPAVAR